jgi:hypothetical protein
MSEKSRESSEPSPTAAEAGVTRQRMFMCASGGVGLLVFLFMASEVLWPRWFSGTLMYLTIAAFASWVHMSGEPTSDAVKSKATSSAHEDRSARSREGEAESSRLVFLCTHAPYRAPHRLVTTREEQKRARVVRYGILHALIYDFYKSSDSRCASHSPDEKSLDVSAREEEHPVVHFMLGDVDPRHYGKVPSRFLKAATEPFPGPGELSLCYCYWCEGHCSIRQEPGINYNQDVLAEWNRVHQKMVKRLYTALLPKDFNDFKFPPAQKLSWLAGRMSLRIAIESWCTCGSQTGIRTDEASQVWCWLLFGNKTSLDALEDSFPYLYDPDSLDFTPKTRYIYKGHVNPWRLLSRIPFGFYKTKQGRDMMKRFEHVVYEDQLVDRVVKMLIALQPEQIVPPQHDDEESWLS